MHNGSQDPRNPSATGGRPPRSSWANGFVPDFLGVLAVFFLYAGDAVPGVNEPHYWTKSAHFWDPSFGAGDLFLESGNAHWLFYATFGFLAHRLPLPVAVWIARFLIWSLLAGGWTWMLRSMFAQADPDPSFPDPSFHDSSSRVASEPCSPARCGLPWVATLAAGVWLAGMHWGHWAGEWVVGGAESKGIAYALIFAGLGCFFRKRWWSGWLLLGLASTFHVVTGVWVMVGAVAAGWWLLEPGPAPVLRWLRRHGWPMAVAALGVVLGAIPALWSDWGVSSEVATQAAMIQVYGRLGHHLAPTLFSATRWQSFGLLVFIGLLAYGLLTRCQPPRQWPFGLRWLVVNAAVALLVAAAGLAIDVGLGSIDHALSARLLKYYWFRWNDVAWPLAIAGGLVCVAYGRLSVAGNGNEARWSVLGLVVCVGAGLIATRYWEHTGAWIPFGDRSRFLSKWDDETAQRQQYRDWLAVCAWIRENTDREGLWLTPRNQQSFKWHAQRAELACTKDMPQDAVSVLEWSKRLETAYQLDENKILAPWTTAQLWELQGAYGLRYVLLDQRVPGQGPPLLPILYPPPGVTNETFSVFEFPPEPLAP